MGKFSKKSAKKIRAREQRDARHTSESSEGSTPTPPAQLSEFPGINVRQEADNYYCKQQSHAATAVYSINRSPTATPTHTDPALPPAPTEEDMNTVEKIDAKLICLERDWAETRSGPFPEGVRNAIADLRASLEN